MSGHASPLRARRRKDLWFALGVLVALAILMWVVVTMQQLSHDLRASNDARDQLASQVQRLGGTPVAGPPGSRGQPGPSVTGPAGVDGRDGLEGPIGPVGPSGKPGKTGASGTAGDDGTPGTVGAAGPQGETGPAGPAGAAGPPGADGKDGTNGRDGTDGKDGQTCPDGYSLQPPADDPDALLCRKDGAPAAPNPPSPSTHTSALEPFRRQYP
ncbi:collagen-like protein [Streptomyces sp. NBC_00932]|uniref:collagen-like protein n=1 Tax=Streptomyces sp. NBC_00932 TaxID=2903690 RepID=UPI0038701CEE|nr:collagen-like protein [Streptomyces sp. NBC_00932]